MLEDGPALAVGGERLIHFLSVVINLLCAPTQNNVLLISLAGGVFIDFSLRMLHWLLWVKADHKDRTSADRGRVLKYCTSNDKVHTEIF